MLADPQLLQGKKGNEDQPVAPETQVLPRIYCHVAKHLPTLGSLHACMVMKSRHGCFVLQITTIDKDDYFVKNAEFTAWLRDKKGKFFNELDSVQSRALFGECAHIDTTSTIAADAEHANCRHQQTCTLIVSRVAFHFCSHSNCIRIV